jgi:sterol 3beta-glucosyltransferase
MRITILALGSRGDVQPLAALGVGLRAAGHRVRLSSFESFAPLAVQYGLDFHPVHGDAQAIVELSARMGLLETRNPLKLMRAMRDSYAQLVDDYISAFSADALRDSEMIINQLPGAIFGRDLAEALRVPHLCAAVIPLTPTRAFANPLLFQHSHGGLFNRATYAASEQMLWALFRGAIGRFRRKLGLPRTSLLFPASRYPVINGFSKHVIPKPRDWGADIYITGYWRLPEDDWQPPPDLIDWLAGGTPPVFIGFGSMPIRDKAATMRVLVEALRLSGQRGILSRGWGDLGGEALPESIRVIDYVPFGWLLPRVAAIIHHGGSGTTGAALSSGVPSMIVPFVADQPFWGERTHTLGVGLPPLPIRELTAERLATAITALVSSEAMRERAALLGVKLRAEDGVARGVGLIERFGFSRSRR